MVERPLAQSLGIPFALLRQPDDLLGDLLAQSIIVRGKSQGAACVLERATHRSNGLRIEGAILQQPMKLHRNLPMLKKRAGANGHPHRRSLNRADDKMILAEPVLNPS